MPKKDIAQSPLQQSSELGPDFYEVESILDKRATSKGDEYLIKWKNFPSPQDFTWEPLEHLQEVQELIEAFNDALHNKLKKQSKKDQDDRQHEYKPEPRQENEEKEPSLSPEPEVTMKRRGRKGQVKKMETEKKYYPKVVNTEHPRKRDRIAKRPESSDQEMPVQKKKKVQEEESRSKGVILLNSEESSMPVGENWFRNEPFRLGAINGHNIVGSTLSFVVNVQTVSGELVCLAQLPESELLAGERDKIKEYMLNYFYGVSRQLAETNVDQIWDQ